MSYLPLLFLAILAFWILRAVFRYRQDENEMEQRLADQDPRRIKLGRSSAKAGVSAAMIRTQHVFVDPSDSWSDDNTLDLSSPFDSGSDSSSPDCSDPGSSDNNCGDSNNQTGGDCGNWGDSSLSGSRDSGFSSGTDFSGGSDFGSSTDFGGSSSDFSGGNSSFNQ